MPPRLTLLHTTSKHFFVPHTINLTYQRAGFAAAMSSATTFYDFKPKDKKGNEFPLTNLKGKVVLVVNTASKCGFTPQFEGLEKLYKGTLSSYAQD